MAIWIDPVTRQRVVYDKYSGDLYYDLIGDSSIAKETVPVIGPWEDHTGSALFPISSIQQKTAGLSNELWGTDPAIDGEKVPALNEVGNNAQTTRRRIIRRRVDFKNGQGKVMNNGRSSNI